MRRTWLAVALVLLLGGSGASAQSSSGWLVYGNDLARSSSTDSSLSPPSVRPAWFTPISGRVTAQALVAQDVPAPGQRTVYVATSKGLVYALAENGYIRWRVDLGQFERICQQIDGYGVTGTPAIDPGTHALYVVDGFGRLHALDLSTGAEHSGWPVRLYQDYGRELDWGASTLVNGSLYVGTGSYCDRPMEGKVIRVELATRQVSRWVSVPFSLGGGGSVWGWGGVAYGARRGSLFVVTGNAFEGGSNVGKRFRESAGHGEQLVELSPDLVVRGQQHPAQIKNRRDYGFAGSPVIFTHRFCGELIAAVNKDGFIYLWRSAKLRAGTLFRLPLSKSTLAAPLLSQPAYSPRTGALYVATPSRLVRIDVDRRCRGRVTWGKHVGNGLFNGSPTIAGNTVWLAENANSGSSLVGYDAASGKERFRSALAGPTYAAPTVVGDRLYVGTFTGGIQGFARASGLARVVGSDVSALLEYRSFSDPVHEWLSRTDGVYATDDGGASWRRIFDRSAVRVARVSATSGMVAVGDRITKCGCRQVRLWTANGGATWHRTRQALGNGFIGAAGTLWWWRGGALTHAAAWPPGARGLRPVAVARVKGSFLDVEPVPGGVAALVTRRVGGLGFDWRPLVVLVQGGAMRKLLLPRVAGDVLARSLEVNWPQIAVHGVDVTAFTRNEEGSVLWRSFDGGASWTVSRN